MGEPMKQGLLVLCPAWWGGGGSSVVSMYEGDTQWEETLCGVPSPYLMHVCSTTISYLSQVPQGS